MYNHNKAQQSKNRVHISWDIVYVHTGSKHQYLSPAHNISIFAYPSAIVFPLL